MFVKYVYGLYGCDENICENSNQNINNELNRLNQKGSWLTANITDQFWSLVYTQIFKLIKILSVNEYLVPRSCAYDTNIKWYKKQH